MTTIPVNCGNDSISCGFTAHKARLCAVMCGIGFRAVLPNEAMNGFFDDVELMKVLLDTRASIHFGSIQPNQFGVHVVEVIGDRQNAMMYIDCS